MRGETFEAIHRKSGQPAVRAACFRVVALFGLALMAQESLGAERLVIPDPAAQKTALATVKEVYKTELASAKSREQFSDLAERMLGNLQDEADSAANDYVLLTQAQALALKGSRVTLSRRIIDMLAERFDVDGDALLVQTMKDLAKGPTDKDFHKELADASLKIAEEAVRAEKPQLALQHLELIEAIARRLKNTDLLKKTTTRRAEITEVQKLVASVKGAEATLLKEPNDPAANEVLGRYLIGTKSDWDQGLRRLSLSSDAKLKEAALKDSAAIDGEKPPTPDEAMQLGDAWWDLAQKQSASLRPALKLRAAQWYSAVLAAQKGLTKAKLEQRIAESEWRDDPELSALMPLNRRQHQFQKAMSVGKGLLTKDFAIVQSLPFDEAVALNESFKDRKFRALRFRSYPTSTGLKVAAIWHRSSLAGEFFIGDADAVKQRDEELRTQGFAPVDLAAFVDADRKVQHLMLWGQTKPSVDTKYSLMIHRPNDGMPWGTSADEAPQTKHLYVDADNKLFFDIIWRQPKKTFYHARGDLKYWEKKLTDINQQLIDVSVVAVGEKLNFSCVFHGLTGVKHSEVHGKTLDENLEEWTKLSESGFKPGSVSVAVAPSGQTYSASVWHASSK